MGIPEVDLMQTNGEFDENTMQDAEFCRSKCPACRPARWRGMGFMRWIVKKAEGSCEKCVAYRKVYGVHAWEKPPSETGRSDAGARC
jgi:hypothetical protein